MQLFPPTSYSKGFSGQPLHAFRSRAGPTPTGLVQSPGSYGAQGPLNTAAHVLLPHLESENSGLSSPPAVPHPQPEASLGTPGALKDHTEAGAVWKPVEFLMGVSLQ